MATQIGLATPLFLAPKWHTGNGIWFSVTLAGKRGEFSFQRLLDGEKFSALADNTEQCYVASSTAHYQEWGVCCLEFNFHWGRIKADSMGFESPEEFLRAAGLSDFVLMDEVKKAFARWAR